MRPSEHATEKDLALLAGGDAGAWRRFTLDRHVGSCAECRAKLAEYRELREQVAAADDLAEANWNALAAEMRANIHLGFEAGQCVGDARRAAWWNIRGWNPLAGNDSLAANRRMAMALACLLVMACAGYALRRSVDGIFGTRESAAQIAARRLTTTATSPAALSPEDAVLESSNTGLELRSGGGSMMLLSHHGAIAHQTVSAEGEIRARYVDGEAGTVTINNVYLQ